MKFFIKTTIFILWFSASGLSQKTSVKFEHISIDQGLSESTVRSIWQDSKGFMWFGTGDGLNRYDGYKFTIYKRNPKEPNSISHNMIWSIFEDSDSILWIGTDLGLNRFDYKIDQFTRYIHDPADTTTISHNSIRAIFEDHLGNLWIGTNGGLNRFDRETNQFTRYFSSPDDTTSLSSSRIRSLFEDRSGDLWIGTYRGFNKFDRETGKFTRYYTHPDDTTRASLNIIRTIVEDRNGIFWIGTNHGLHTFNPKIEQFNHYFNDPADNFSICSNSIRSVIRDSTGDLWIGTTAGLNRFDRENNRFIRYQSGLYDPFSLSVNEIRSLFEDRSGILWVGAYNGGLNKFDRKKTKFKHYHKDNIYPASINHNTVQAFHEDDFGKVWIGTNGGGLNIFDRNARRYSYYTHDPGNPASLSSDRIYAICEDKNGNVWLGTNGEGINKVIFSHSKGKRVINKFVHFQHDPNDSLSLSDDNVRVIYEDRAENLWIGTFGGGINLFDRQNNRFTRFKNNPKDPKSISNNVVYVIYEDRQGELWIGTRHGLNRFDREKRSFIRYMADFNNPNSLSDKSVLSIYEDQAGMLWIGTYGGLNKLDRSREMFSHYNEQDGLPNDVVYGILEDIEGNLWLSTNKGLAKFNPKTETFQNYDVKDGLQGNEFNLGAYYQNKNGEMFFGGNNGYNAFYPHKIVDNPHIPPVVITDFQLFNKSIGIEGENSYPFQKAITFSDAIKLSCRENIISFEFAALDYSAPEKHQYTYILEGFDENWNYTQSRRFVTYTNLSPGDYAFKVKGTNNNGVWNEQGVVLKIRIVPPFWQTTLFKIFAAVFFVGFIYAAYRLKIRAIEMHRQMLEKEVAERTEELVTKNKQISLQKSKLVQTLDRLKKGEEQYRGIFESVRDGLIIFDDDGNIVEANPEACRAHGYSRDEFLKLNGKDLVHPNYYSNFKRFKDQLTSGDQFSAESVNLRKDGSTFHVEVRGTNFSYNGKLHRLAVVRDITERRKAEEMLRRYELIISSSTELMALLDTQYVHLAINDAYLKFYNRKREDILGRPVSEIFGNRVFTEFMKDRLDECVRGKEVYYYEWFDLATHGRKYMYVVYIPVIEKDRSVSGVVVSIKDVTELQEKNDQLAQLLKELKDTQSQLIQSAKMASLGNLVAGIVHEINSPMGVLTSSTDVTIRAITKIIDGIETSKSLGDIQNNQQIQKAMDALQNNTQITIEARERINKIINSLKRFVLLDSVAFHKADVHEGIESTISLVQHELGTRIKIRKEFGKLPEIFCYPGELNQVFLSLIQNAITAIKNQGTITIRTSSEKNFVKIEIGDDGTGIPPKQLQRLFEFSLTSDASRVKMGSGLAISYQIIDKHNGKIDVTSEVGKGSRFTITLPIDPRVVG